MHRFKSVVSWKNIKWFLLLEILIVCIYGLMTVAQYSVRELVFDENDMQLKYGGEVEDGNYLDTSFENAEAVVTPAFQMPKGVYYIEASFVRHGIVKAGLIYDVPRNGKELVDGDEFVLNPDKQAISYRIRIHDDSKLRFKLRLTGDAVDGDYIQLLQVRIVSSRMTCAYRIFLLVFLMLLTDLILWGYVRYYAKWSAERRAVFGVLIFTSFFTSLPLFQSGLTAGVDLVFHLSRFEGLYRGFGFGGGGIQFPVRVQPGWLDGYGYAVSVFYGDILMYVPALLRAVGFTLEECYKVYLGGVNITTVFLSFYAFKRITQKDVPAMIGSVLYAGSAARVGMMYTVVLGGVSGMMFYPLIVAGFYLLFTEEVESEGYRRIWILLTVGFTGILMTHMLSCLMWGLYSVLLCVVMWKRLLRKDTFLALLKAAGVSVLLNLWYLMPFLQYMLTEKLRINSSMAKKEDIKDYYAALEDFTQEGKSLYQLFTDDDVFGFSILLVLLLFVLTLSVQGRGKRQRQMKIFSIFTLFSIVVCTKLFPFVTLAKGSRLLIKLFRTIQYQYRFISIAVAMTACLAALFFATDLFDRKKLFCIAGVLCCITLYQNLEYFATLSFDQIYLDAVSLESRMNKELYSYTVGNGEYLPAITDTTRFVGEIESGEQVNVEQTARNGLSFTVTVENGSAEEQQILFPVLYYGGYRALDVVSHEKLETSIGDNGRVAVTVPPNYLGTVQLGYHEPLLWRIAEVISVITLVAVIMVICNPKDRKIWIPKLAGKGVGNGN